MVTERQRINFRLKDPLSGKIDLVAYRGFTEEEIEASVVSRRTHERRGVRVGKATGPSMIIRARSFGTLGKDSVGGVDSCQSRVEGFWILGISDDHRDPFTPQSEVLQAMGSVIGIAIENCPAV